MSSPSLKIAEAVPSTEPLVECIDARPILARTPESIVRRAEEARDEIYDHLSAACDAEGIRALLLKSPPLQMPPWVKLEAWLPHGRPETTQRHSIVVRTSLMPFHDLPIEYALEYSSRGGTVKIERLTRLTRGSLAALLAHQVHGRPAPSLRGDVVRDHPFKFWRPRNECRHIRADWLWRTAIILLLVWGAWAVTALAAMDDPGSDFWMSFEAPLPIGVLLAVTGIASGWVWLTRALRHVGWRVLAPLAFLVALLIELTFRFSPEATGDSFIGLTVLELLAGTASAAVACAALRQRFRLTRSVGRPPGEPRDLRRVDSWQVVVWQAGADERLIRDRLLARIAQSPMPGLRHFSERIWYWGLDGYEEREQLVLQFRRGMLFCQIYQYGRDLYVGWDAHLNLGVWVEKTVASGLDRQEKLPVSYNTIVPGVQGANEYDVVDVDCLLEWTHAQITQVLRQYLAERQIDQEIDFAIIRGERQGLVQREESGEKSQARRRFRRAA